MKKQILFSVVVGIIATAANFAAAAMVTPPPGAPTWWNSEVAENYAYGWWSVDIISGESLISPPDNANHWASNFLTNTDFTGVIGLQNQTISMDLNNLSNPDLYKKVYIYITGTSDSMVDNIESVLDVAEGTFTGNQSWTINGNGGWTYLLEGDIHPQPDFVRLTFTVPGMTGVTEMWAGEVCVPEPATMSLLGMGVMTLVRRKRQ